jgi:hypothetical protein
MEAEARRELRRAVAAMTAALGEMRASGSPALTLEPHMEAVARCAATLGPPEDADPDDAGAVGNPLAVEPTGEGVQLVAADADGATLATIALGINGPNAMPVALWDFIYVLNNLLGAVLVVVVIGPLIDISLRPILYWVGGMGLPGSTLNYRAVRGLRASIIADDAGGGGGGGGGMWQLLRREVSAEAAEALAEAAQGTVKSWKGQQVGNAVVTGLLTIFILQYTTIPAIVILSLMFAGWLCGFVEAVTGNMGTAFVPVAACKIVEDNALRLSFQVRAAGGLSIAKRGEELDQILVGLNELNSDLLTVASIAQPGIIVSTAHFRFCPTLQYALLSCCRHAVRRQQMLPQVLACCD